MENEAKKKLLEKKNYRVDDLAEIVRILRAPDGCPWDREQTHESLRRDLIEETYEVIEAIEEKDAAHLREELGDVLLQVALHTEMEREAGNFDLDGVANDVCVKMIARHPHVFGDVSVTGTEDVLRNWEKIKSAEKSRLTVTDKLRAVPRCYPALIRAQKVGKKAPMMDFPDAASVSDKVREELDEVTAAVAAGDAAGVKEEVGDLLLSVASLARKLGVDAEEALRLATDKFILRFARAEAAAAEKGEDLREISDEERENLWNFAKK